MGVMRPPLRPARYSHRGCASMFPPARYSHRGYASVFPPCAVLLWGLCERVSALRGTLIGVMRACFRPARCSHRGYASVFPPCAALDMGHIDRLAGLCGPHMVAGGGRPLSKGFDNLCILLALFSLEEDIPP